MASDDESKYIIDESPDYDFGDVRLLAPESDEMSSFGPVDESEEDDDDDESPGSGEEAFDPNRWLSGFLHSSYLIRMLSHIRPGTSNCFKCGADLYGPYCYACGLKTAEPKKIFERI